MPSRGPSPRRSAWPSLMPTSSARWWTSTCRSPAPDTATANRPCLASWSRRWSRNPWPVAPAGASLGGASRSQTTFTEVSRVTLSTSARLATGGDLVREHVGERREEGVVLGRQPHAHAQAAREPRQVVLPPDDHAAGEQPGVDRGRVVDGEQQEVRDAVVDGHARQLAQRRRDADALAARRADAGRDGAGPREAREARGGPQRPDAGRGQAHAPGRGRVGVRQQVAEPRTGEPRGLRE